MEKTLNLEKGLRFKDKSKDLSFSKVPSQFYLKIGVRKELVEEVLENLDRYYTPYVKKKTLKDHTQKVKRGIPQVREIDPSVSDLKWIQKRIAKRIFSKFEFPINIQGGLQKKDNIKNAKLHLGKKFHLCSDLSDFFPNVSYTEVYSRLVEIGFSPDVSSLITRLCTYKYRIPQGVSTSTYLTNLIFYPLDLRIIEFCELRKLFYSRFVDDIAISGSYNFKDHANDLLDFIHGSKYKINQAKTKFSVGKAEITGIIVSNNVLNVRKSVALKILKETDQKKRQHLLDYKMRVKKA